MAIVNASCDMTAFELDNQIEIAHVDAHGSITEDYFRLRFETVTVYLTPRQLKTLHDMIEGTL